MASNLAQQRQENEMFVYSVSHDLRSPLINLQGFSEELSLSYRDIQSLFERENVPASVRERGLDLLSENIEESIRFIQTAVGRLARIIDALLRLSRAGRVEYQCQSTDVAPIVPKILEALHDTISGKKAEIVVGELPPAWGDPTAVEQIFANLIGNSVQYLDPARSGRIEVGSDRPSGPGNLAGLHVYFVKDNGLGIPEAYQQRVFTPFNRLHANVAQGEGIGLTLVRRVVERLGGKIWLESTAGVGSTFFVALPSRPRRGLSIGSRGTVTAPTRSLEENRRHGRRAALDRAGRRRRWSREPGGAQPETRRHRQRHPTPQGRPGRPRLPSTASEHYADRKPSHPILLLLDIKMPRSTGSRCSARSSPTPSTALIPVIMLTTTDDPREIQRCYELGCSVYITKPVDYQAFVEAINRLGLFLQVVRIPENAPKKP